MRKAAITLAAAAAMLAGGVLTWQANAQMERGASALCEMAKNFTPVEKAACGPHYGAHCGPYHHWVCGGGRCWCARC